MNLPNKITLSRIVIVFIILILANIYYMFSPTISYTIQIIGAVLAVIAALTDMFDGYIARKLNMVSNFGKLIDPLADKIFVMTIFIIFASKISPYTHMPLIPSWIVVIVLAREFLVTGLRSLAATKGEVIAADKYGKIKTASQMVLFAFGGLLWLEILPLVGAIFYIWIAAIMIVALITVFSGLNYFVKYKHLYLNDVD